MDVGLRGPEVKELQVPNKLKLTGDFGRWMVLATAWVPTVGLSSVMVLGPSQAAGVSVSGLGVLGSVGIGPGAFHGEAVVRSEEFLASIRASESLGADVKAQVAERYQSLMSAGAAPAEAVTECLQLAYPAYQAALTALEADDLVTAWQGLESLLDHADRFLAVDAAFFLGRSYLLAGQHERAIEPLQ